MRSLFKGIYRSAGEDVCERALYPDLSGTLSQDSQPEKESAAEEPPAEPDILREAQKQAEAILARAREDAARIKDSAYEEGYISGMEKGCADGEKKAYEEQEEKLRGTWLETEREVEKYLLDVQHAKDKILEQYLDDLKDIALSIGEKILQTGLRSSGDVVKNMILSATGKLKKTAWAKIYISGEPKESARRVQGDAELLRELSRISDNVKIIVMEEAAPGTCIVELPQEVMDVSVGTQLENIREILNNARV